ncbi:hypothetical protein LCGC14_1875450 [marine sediment metagenome]|uniref:Uncharacterized protein n=1 Tax=marine sediment metagenome TaxID=412755 RepID=A0A0F9G3R7_9ZZZZ
MEIEKVEEAIYEARRFIDKANLALQRVGDSKYFYYGKETAACRRASMDLTRSLAELRK